MRVEASVSLGVPIFAGYQLKLDLGAFVFAHRLEQGLKRREISKEKRREINGVDFAGHIDPAPSSQGRMYIRGDHVHVRRKVERGGTVENAGTHGLDVCAGGVCGAGTRSKSE